MGGYGKVMVTRKGAMRPASRLVLPKAPNIVRSVYGRPINLMGTVTVLQNSTGSLPENALFHPNDLPMELHGVKLVAYLSGSPTGDVGGHILSMKLALGNIPLTNGFVPSFVLAKSTDDYGSTFGAAAPSQMAFRWKFDRPFFVPAGVPLSVSFRHNGLTDDSIVVEASFEGRTLEPGWKPRRVFYPYAAGYSSIPLRLDDTTADATQSSEDDLTNVRSMPLQVCRFVGRLTAGAIETSIGGDASQRQQSDAASSLVDIRIVASKGFPVVRNRTPFPCVFYYGDRAWDVRATLTQKEYYKVYIDTVAPTTALTAGTFMQAHIGMTGYSEVAA